MKTDGDTIQAAYRAGLNPSAIALYALLLERGDAMTIRQVQHFTGRTYRGCRSWVKALEAAGLVTGHADDSGATAWRAA